MTNKQKYIEKVQEILNTDWAKTHKALVEATNEYLETTPQEDQDNFDQMDYGTNFERDLDSLAFTRAWIQDRLNGKTGRKARGSMSKKMRKALGYTYP